MSHGGPARRQALLRAVLYLPALSDLRSKVWRPKTGLVFHPARAPPPPPPPPCVQPSRRGPRTLCSQASVWGHVTEWRGEDGARDDPGCAFSRDATALRAALPAHMAPICFYDQLHVHPL